MRNAREVPKLHLCENLLIAFIGVHPRSISCFNPRAFHFNANANLVSSTAAVPAGTCRIRRSGRLRSRRRIVPLRNLSQASFKNRSQLASSCAGVDRVEQRPDGFGGLHVAGGVADHQHVVFCVAKPGGLAQRFLFAAGFLSADGATKRSMSCSSHSFCRALLGVAEQTIMSALSLQLLQALRTRETAARRAPCHRRSRRRRSTTRSRASVGSPSSALPVSERCLPSFVSRFIQSRTACNFGTCTSRAWTSDRWLQQIERHR